jgi:deoxyribodipyrimidine photolyase
MFDPKGEYVRQWVPELEHVPVEYIHEPWRMNANQQIEYKVQLGLDYPRPCVDPNIAEERRKRRAEKRDRFRDAKLLGRQGKNRPNELSHLDSAF